VQGSLVGVVARTLTPRREEHLGKIQKKYSLSPKFFAIVGLEEQIKVDVK